MNTARLLSVVGLSTVTLAVGLAFAGCGQKQEEPKKSKKAAADATAASRLSITADGATGTTINFATGAAVSVNFTVNGTTTASEVALSLTSGPSGGTFNAANTLKPVFSWASPVDGAQPLSILVRDLTACAAEKSADECTLAATGAQSSGSSYDTVGSFTLQIGAAVSTSTGTTSITPPATTSTTTTTPASTNLISMITGLLGGAGGAGGIPNLQGLLGGANQGQLQTILTQLMGQGGAGGVNIQQIIQQLQAGLGNP